MAHWYERDGSGKHASVSISPLFDNVDRNLGNALTFPAEYHRFRHLDQSLCGHLDHHSPVACRHHVHAPSDDAEVAEDHPQVRHVPGGMPFETPGGLLLVKPSVYD